MKADEIRKVTVARSEKGYGGSMLRSNADFMEFICAMLQEMTAQCAEQTDYLTKMHQLHAETYKRNCEVNAINTRLNEESEERRREKHEMEMAFLRKQTALATTPLISEPDSASDENSTKRPKA